MCCFQWMLKTDLDMRVPLLTGGGEVMVHASHPYKSTDAGNNRSLNSFGNGDFQILFNLLLVRHAAALRCLMSIAIFDIQESEYLK